jgi:hypothetical protein
MKIEIPGFRGALVGSPRGHHRLLYAGTLYNPEEVVSYGADEQASAADILRQWLGQSGRTRTELNAGVSFIRAGERNILRKQQGYDVPSSKVYP